MNGKSPELEAILGRWIEATASGNGRTVRNLLSRDPNALYCGTGPEELITGQMLQDGIIAHIEEIEGATVEPFSYHSQVWDKTGWAIAQCKVTHLETGNTLLWRLSGIFRLEDGVWKAHQLHGSYATDYHETVMGMHHSAFQELLNSASDLDLHIGRSGSATVMFTDICGSSALVEAMGDARWTETIQNHVVALTDIIDAHDGRIIKSLGDGTMSTFPAAGAGMRAAQEIQRIMTRQTTEPVLRVRVGLHTGDVIEAGDDFFGTVVNKAARVAALAAPGEIRVSDATRVMVGGAHEFQFSDPATLPLKGLDGEHLVHRLEWRT